MAKRSTLTNPRQARVDAELVAPVAFKAEACKMADESGLPMTVYAVADRECFWFQVHNQWFPESRTVAANELKLAGLITYLPTLYFVGAVSR